MATFNATFSSTQSTFEATLSSQSSVDISAEFGEATIIDETWEEYTGDYEVTPSTLTQTLDTDTKRTVEDIVINAIPYAETSNEYGTTVVIAS